MGSRANYIIIEGGAVTVYYSHWGAQSVPSVVIGGPAETSAYIRGLQPVDGLLDTTWAEGGMLLDADTHTLVLWGGNNLNSYPYLRRLFLPLTRLIWPEWAVSWATRGIVDFAEYPGVARALDLDPASVIDTAVADVWEPYAEAEVRAPHAQPWISTVVTVKWDDGRVADYTFDQFPTGYLTFGSGLLDILCERPPDALPREDGDGKNDLQGGAYADVAAQTLSVWEPSPLNPAYLEHVARAWPGWQVEWHLDGLAYQVALSGRDPALVTLPIAQTVAELLRDLVGDGDQFDPVQFARMTLAHEDPATTTFASGFFQMDAPPPATAERRAWLLQLVRQVVDEQIDGGADQ